mmetsp:Transcript_21912/g.38796  ORF Transcript_21912/g.38796 Transcript_21912/m.38796 type:complete len:266 (+) Transcript_21912:244-1041(+)
MATFREKGNAALAANKMTDAIDEYTAGLENNAETKERTLLLSNRSMAFYRLHEWQKAIKDADEVIALRPDWEKGYVRKSLAMIKSSSSTPQQVLDVYEAGLAAVPDSETLKLAAKSLRSRLDLLAAKPPARSEAPPAARPSSASKKDEPRLTWNEEVLACHDQERGILYGKMKIDHPDTPFLVYDEEMATKHNKIGTVEDMHAEPVFVDINELQQKLGILQLEQEHGVDSSAGKGVQSFEERRKNVYKSEGQLFKSAADENITCD